MGQCMSNINIYAHDKTIVVGEIKGGLYSVGAYSVATTLATLPLMCIATFCGQLVQWLIATSASSEYIQFPNLMMIFLVGVLTLLAMDSLFQFFAFLTSSAA